MRITVLNETSSSGYKVKLQGAMVLPAGAFDFASSAAGVNKGQMLNKIG